MALSSTVRSIRDLIGLGLVISMFTGCTTNEIPAIGDSSSGDDPGVCIPGQQVTCSCPGTVDGIQICSAGGDGYEPCQCGDPPPPPPGDSTTGDPPGTDTSTTLTTGSTGTTGTTGSTGSTGSTDTGSTGTTGDPGVCDMYMGGAGTQCDPWLQDCPAGEKCIAFAAGGGSWDSTHCWPIANSPGQPGDVCTVQGSGTSGDDDCDIGSMCWDVDPETNMGVCIALCMGCPDEPTCDDPGDLCVVSNNDVLTLCLPGCDPLLQDCVAGQACYPVNDAFLCAPDASGVMGVYGDPCEFINVCDPGLVCLAPGAVPGCAGAFGCCSEFCDLTDPAGDAQCSGAPGGQQCQAWYPMGMAPAGYEDVGACTL